MKRGRGGWVLAMLAAAFVLLQYSSWPGLLTDSDTMGILAGIKERGNPLSWFATDWPIRNHFYRPVSTLVFEADFALHPGSAGGFGFTNALLIALSLLGLAWFVAELRKSWWSGALASWIAAIMIAPLTAGHLSRVIEWATYGGAIVLGVLIIIYRRFELRALVAWLGWFFIVLLFAPLSGTLSDHTLAWIPGRTATSMSVFAMIALASYARYARLSSERDSGVLVSALDIPATRMSVTPPPQAAWPWMVLSLVATALALGCYEQAVMIPAVIFCIGLYFYSQHARPRFGVQILFWALVVGYAVLRVQLVPLEPSGYQKQQFRFSVAALGDLLDYGFPAFSRLKLMSSPFELGIMMLLTPGFWSPIFALVSNTAAWVSTGRRWLAPTSLFLAALLAFLPMCFLKTFGHYHFWPHLLRAAATLPFLAAWWRLVITAVLPRAVQAPQRSRPAPGSLPNL